MAKLKKNIFIDTNIFITCVATEIEGHDIDILEKLKAKLDSDEVNLLLPEVIRSEVSNLIAEKFVHLRRMLKVTGLDRGSKEKKELEQEGKRKFVLQIQTDAIGKANEEIVQKIDQRETSVKSLLEEIFGHRNTTAIALTADILISGLRRSSLGIRPAYVNFDREKKTHYMKDLDCIAWESILSALNSEAIQNKDGLIVCTNDSDYFDSENRGVLHEQITGGLTGFGKIHGYISPLDLLEKEFSAKYSETQQKDFEAFTLATLNASGISGTVTATGYDPASNFVTVPDVGVHPAGVFTVGGLMDDYYGVHSNLSVYVDDVRLSRSAKYCPYCAEDIEGLFTSAWNVTHYSQSVFYCPGCRRRLIVK